MFKKKRSAYKKCPRCGNKCLLSQEKCDDCGLIFSRLQYASNKAAKRRILKFDKDCIKMLNGTVFPVRQKDKSKLFVEFTQYQFRKMRDDI